MYLHNYEDLMELKSHFTFDNFDIDTLIFFHKVRGFV